MGQRHWTVVIVPHGSDSPRTLAVSETKVRILKWLAASAATLVAVATIMLAVSIARGGLLAAFGLDSTGRTLTTMRTRVAVLQDTIASLERRNDQMRLFAGLPATDSAGTTPPDLALANDSASGSSSGSSIGHLASETRTDIDGLVRRANDLSASFAQVSLHLSKDVERLSNTPSIMPTTGWLSSEFSRARFHPILHLTRPHEGIDLAAPYGTPVVAPAAGVVERVTVQTGYGNVLEIDHGNGVETKYAHLSRIDVHVGQHVTRGQPIAAVGNTGLSTGPHLHYEVHVNGKVVDPLTYVLPGAIPE
jgi:murein DD-endopeptidase MepM/ murein hydrolase activator NlpD